MIDEAGELRAGTVLSHPDLCASCRDRPCKGAASIAERLVQAAPGVFVGTCGRGVDFAAISASGEYAIINGLLIDDVGSDRPRRIKKELASNVVKSTQLAAWREEQLRAGDERGGEVDEKVREALEMFHDVQTAASTIIRSAEQLQRSQTGRDDDERFANLPREAQTLVKAAGLLELRMRTMPIVTNPAAASYGNRLSKPIYRIVDRMVRTLRPLAETRDVGLNLSGPSVRTASIFESFDLLPLTLIENAIKYSARDQVVEVSVTDSQSDVVFRVSSFSPWIEHAERQRIFDKRYRAEGARRLRHAGSGLGLYIAEAVAVAHSTHVHHSTDEGNVSIDGARYCTNEFRFHIR